MKLSMLGTFGIPRKQLWCIVIFAVVSAIHSLSNEASSTSRRDFLAKTATVVSTAPLWIPGLDANAEETLTSASTSSISTSKLPPMGLGCWAWGDSLFWGYNPKDDQDLKDVFDYAVSKNSPVLFDTAELYGLGRSESLLGEYTKTTKEGDVILASKFAALPFRTKPQSVVKACEASVKRLGGKPIDLYQIHFPNAFANDAYWDGMAMAYEKGLIKSVGVSNYGIDATRACHSALAKRGIPLAANQIQYSLLYKYPEQNGLLQACKDLGVEVLSYSPMALGLLTGKYNVDNVNKIQGPRKKLFAKIVASPEYSKLLSSMREVASAHDNASVPQVAINWCRAKGTIPIPGARNLKQVQSNYGALDWEMTPEEVRFLDQSTPPLFSYIQPDASPFPKFDKDTGLKMFDS